MAAPTPTNDNLNFIHKIGMNDSMIEFTKMNILYAIYSHPNDDYEKANFVSTKFMEKYGGYWSCCFLVKGGLKMFFFDYNIRVEYKDYAIYIWKSS